jgi:hypothetical protein
MAGLTDLLFGYVWSCFQSHERLKAEIVVLRHQLNILKRKAPKRWPVKLVAGRYEHDVKLGRREVSDVAFLAVAPRCLDALIIGHAIGQTFDDLENVRSKALGDRGTIATARRDDR